ncbi:MAG: hypothetical protein JWM11_627 [Planctomycetaceae bacterium]|nr:hypothetical protein [Planctomycetaceae bacterium]
MRRLIAGISIEKDSFVAANSISVGLKNETRSFVKKGIPQDCQERPGVELDVSEYTAYASKSDYSTELERLRIVSRCSAPQGSRRGGIHPGVPDLSGLSGHGDRIRLNH